ncbi:iron ABC transporter permease [Clostridium sp. HBUAS56010]|uniref:FecCD family ABC transporter permease n=1 Tax=Clostridium sp. HBUAS56010 TaxID=2571127 RepID=UPI00163D7415|nr:iron ABC transporter permease [Clostridium sp. HBUAS56010]
MKEFRGILLFPLLIAALFATIVFVIAKGSTDIPLSTVYGILTDQIFHGGKELKEGLWARPDYQIIWNIRLPRVLFGALCGAGLALCGAVMQALVLNPIADPYILGISSGASSGAACALLLPIPFFHGPYQTVIMAMAGALLSSAFVYTTARISGGGTLRPVTLLLSGMAVNAVMSAVTGFLIFAAKSSESIAAVYNWQMGSLAAAQWTTLPVPALGVLSGICICVFQSGKLNLMMMGDEDAAALGLSVKHFRVGMFIICSVIVASLVCVTGIIGFVGLVVPHVVRMLIRSSNNRLVLPLSALLGAIYLLWADSAARSAFHAAELPIGVITAFVGAPFFLYLMVKKGYESKD